MSNTCFTGYTITGPKEQLHQLNAVISKLDNENTFENLWLGTIVEYLGGDPEKIECRGEIYGFDFEDDYTKLNIEYAWAERPAFRHFLEEKFPGIKIIHFSEETALEGIWTNDPNCRFKYYFDTDAVDLEPEWFENLEDARKYLIDNGIQCDADKESIDNALEEYQEETDEYAWLFEIEYIDN